MNVICVYTIFDKRTGRPRCTGIKDGDNVIIRHLYHSNERPGIRSIETTVEQIRRVLSELSEKRPIVLSNFKQHIQQFQLDIRSRPYNIYDVHLPEVAPPDSSQDAKLVETVLAKMATIRPLTYQKILTNAAVVYQDLENRGLCYFESPVFPKWSLATFSGRSKTTGFNIQGLAESVPIRPRTFNTSNVSLIHFDWICADIRIAALLSGDKALCTAFDHNDPYVTMQNTLSRGLSRDECKLLMLKSINSMNYTNIDLITVYPDLARWIRSCKETLHSGDKYLESILRRKFRLLQAKNELAVLNGVMQGSVAHAMQSVLRRVWEKIPSHVVTDIHDSLVVASSHDRQHIDYLIDLIIPIMMHPFDGVLRSNPTFPVKVSVGDKWREWQPVAVYRSTGTEYVEQQTIETISQTQAEASEEAKPTSKEYQTKQH